ncbi:MAG: AraC family transcriptional regulator [Rhodospirillales bacterium]|nr:AraC family transcriptional regulator [Rhodospirillales bacterium]
MATAHPPQQHQVKAGTLSSFPLAGPIAQWTEGQNAVETQVPGLTLHRWETPTDPTSYFLGPSICLIAQGRKRLMLGDEVFIYDAHQFLITSVDLPVVAQIIEASADKPYLGLTLSLDLRSIAQFIVSNEVPPAASNKDRLGIAVGEVSQPLLDAFQRLLGLLDNPEDISALAPLVKQEIAYRLLASDQGARLRRMTSMDTQNYQIARSIDWLKDNFDASIRVEDLAARAGMSASAFHNHFRSMTAMSPLQYQKKMRLTEARRLMLTEHMDASTAAFEVGYESPSQFSREYSRQFGAPPSRDIKNLTEVTSG